METFARHYVIVPYAKYDCMCSEMILNIQIQIPSPPGSVFPNPTYPPATPVLSPPTPGTHHPFGTAPLPLPSLLLPSCFSCPSPWTVWARTLECPGLWQLSHLQQLLSHLCHHLHLLPSPNKQGPEQGQVQMQCSSPPHGSGGQTCPISLTLPSDHSGH